MSQDRRYTPRVRKARTYRTPKVKRREPRPPKLARRIRTLNGGR